MVRNVRGCIDWRHAFLVYPCKHPSWNRCCIYVSQSCWDYVVKHVEMSSFLDVRVPNITNLEGKRIVCKQFFTYRILPNITAPPIEPPQLYSVVIEDNFLFKTLFTEWKSDHFWPRYGHFCVISNTTTPNHCLTARRFYCREYGNNTMLC